MYTPTPIPLPPAERVTRLRLSRGLVHRNVWLLGFTSLLTDISSEMITAILPLYLVVHLGLNPLAFGAVDGIHQGMSAIMRWVAGFAGDRTRRHKEIAAIGYALSAAVRPLWLVGGASWSALALLVGLDRIGKGIRTAPRDALISLSSSRAALGTAFGVHRALDATGAMLGPLAAFAIVAAYPNRFDLIFIVSFAAAMAGLGVLLLGVENADGDAGPLISPAPSWIDAFALLRNGSFRIIVIVGTSLALVTISDAFIYLALQRKLQFDVSLLPLLYVGTGLAYLTLAGPLGYLADRLGRPLVFMSGYVVLLLAYAAVWTPTTLPWMMVLVPVLLGIYYAATDGVVQAIASARLEPRVRGSGLAMLGTATSLARMLSSLLVGWAWLSYGYERAVATLAAALGIVIVGASLMLARAWRHEET